MKIKSWDITLRDVPSTISNSRLGAFDGNTVQATENDEFYTTDTEAFLIFNLLDEDFHPTSATITLHNRTDGSVVNEDVDVIDGTIAYEMREEVIEHAGGWQAQLVYEQDKDGVPEKYTSKVVKFNVSGHLLDDKKPLLFLVENWNNFILSAESLIEDWENAEAERESAESRREETLQEVYLELDDIRATLSALDPNDTSGELQQIKDDISRIETDLANITPGNYDQEIQQINDELTTINNTLSTYETPSGAQEKADAAETNAKAYADSILTDAGGGVSSWNDLTDKPSTFTPSEHTHTMTEVNGLQAALNGLETTDGAQTKATAAETSANAYTDAQIADLPDPSWDEITGRPLDLETTSGAQAKADAAEQNAKTYVEAEYAPRLTELEQNEELRVVAERERDVAEDSRVLEENKRVSSEIDRESNEADRQSNETDRESNEVDRQLQEESREIAETARQEAYDDSAASAAEAKESAAKSQQAMSDYLSMLGEEVATLGEDGKLSANQIPALAINDTFVVHSKEEIVALVAERGDVAVLVHDENVSDAYILTVDDPSVLDNWIKLGVSYVAEAGHAETATIAVNSQKINGHRVVALSEEEYNLGAKEPETVYLVGEL